MLMPTDLPEPVVPAISRCGIRARSAMTGSPPMVLPSASGSLRLHRLEILARRASRADRRSRGSALGSSMPMALRPGTTATRAEMALIERAMSSASADDARRLDAGRRLEFVERDDRAGADIDDVALDAEILQHAFEHAGVLLQRVLRQASGPLRRALGPVR